jgi:hypothetical protein
MQAAAEAEQAIQAQRKKMSILLINPLNLITEKM